MKNRVWMKSALRVVTALGICAGLTVGINAGHSAAASDEATPQATPTPEPNFQTVWQCFTPNDTPIGLPKSPQSACLAACPAPNHCQACIFDHGAVDCG